MQFQVPQFIETEDKIVGPFSLKQFMFLGMTAGICFVLFFLLKTWLWFIFTILIGGGGLALALVKVNGRSLTTIFFSALKFYWKPQTFVWQPKNPEVKKEEEIDQMAKPGTSIESIIMGLALKSTWRKLQTGSKQNLVGTKLLSEKIKEKYQIFEKITGERRAARRIDYRY